MGYVEGPDPTDSRDCILETSFTSAPQSWKLARARQQWCYLSRSMIHCRGKLRLASRPELEIQTTQTDGTSKSELHQFR